MHNLCCKFTPLQYADVRHNFAGKFPAKKSLSIAHFIDDFLMPQSLTRFITNDENISKWADFPKQICDMMYSLISIRPNYNFDMLAMI